MPLNARAQIALAEQQEALARRIIAAGRYLLPPRSLHPSLWDAMIPDLQTAIRRGAALENTPPSLRQANPQFVYDQTTAYREVLTQWTRQGPGVRAQVLELTAGSAPSGRITQTTGPGTAGNLSSLHDARRTHQFNEQLSRNNRRGTGARFRNEGTANPAPAQAQRLQLAQPLGKLKRSQFTFFVNSNRSVDSGMRGLASGLYKAMQQVLHEMLTEMQETGAWMTYWAQTEQQPAPSDDDQSTTASWNTVSVPKFIGNFRIEVAPVTGLLHAHVYIGLQHRIMVQVNSMAFAAAFEARMNEINLAGSDTYFGQDLVGATCWGFKMVRKKTLEDGEAWFLEYVIKEDEEARNYWSTQLAQRGRGGGAPPPAPIGMAQAIQSDVNRNDGALLRGAGSTDPAAASMD